MDLVHFLLTGILTILVVWIKWAHTKALHESTQKLSADIHNNGQEFSRQLVMLRSVLEKDVERDKKRFEAALLASGRHEDLLRAADELYWAWSRHTAAEHDLWRAEDAAREEEAHEPVAEAEGARAAEVAKLSAAINAAESKSIKAEEEYEKQRRDAQIWLERNDLLLSRTVVIAFRSTLSSLADYEPRILDKHRDNLRGILRAEFGVDAVDTSRKGSPTQ